LEVEEKEKEENERERGTRERGKDELENVRLLRFSSYCRSALIRLERNNLHISSLSIHVTWTFSLNNEESRYSANQINIFKELYVRG